MDSMEVLRALRATAKFSLATRYQATIWEPLFPVFPLSLSFEEGIMGFRKVQAEQMLGRHRFRTDAADGSAQESTLTISIVVV
jgi:hypothetical protein